MKKKLIIFLAVLLVFFVAVVMLYDPWIKAAYTSALLTTEINPNFPLKPLKFYKNSVARDIVIDTKIGKIKTDIYKPGGEGKHPAILFTLGTVASKEDEALVNFSNALSKSGMVVMTADLPDLTAGYIFSESVEGTVELYKYLLNQPFVDVKKAGMGGFCGGGSVVLVASAESEIASKVKFVVAISPYFSMKNYTKAVLTGSLEPEVNNWRASDDIRKSFIWGYSAYIGDQKLRGELRERVLKRDFYDLAELSKLGNEERSFYEFLKNSEGKSFDNLYSNLPLRAREIVAKISPESISSKINSKVFILNDNKGTYVPIWETHRLANSLPKGKVVYSQVESFDHVRPAIRLQRWEGVKQASELLSFFYQVLRFVYD